jgi:GMP synthase (glutamine-hydrolysing)
MTTMTAPHQPILVVLHRDNSAPGRVGHALQERGYPLDVRRPCFGDPLPGTLAEHAGAIVFGGPMSANDTHEFVRRETDWIAVPLAERKPFLGICLGAQMLSRHLGGKVAPHAEGLVEIGYFPLQPTEAGRKLGDWPAQVYHWHREGFTLTQGCELLATGDTFANQAFRYDGEAYGLQFHPEVTRLMMHRWSVTGAHRFTLKGAQNGAEQLSGQILYDAAVGQWLSGFLDLWLKPEALAEAQAA